MRILVVDDDANAVTALCALLEMDGYEVVGVRRPEEALERLKAERFDAVVTDLEMPRVHGLEVVRAALAVRADMPVVVVTAYGNSPASASALSLGARRVLGKPLRYEALVSELAGVAAGGLS